MRRKDHPNHPAAALAKQKNTERITGDPEFKAVEKGIKIQWIA